MSTYEDVLGGVTADTGYKPPVRVASTADLGTALTGTPIIDGVQTAIGDRVLLWQQTDQTTNGIWTTASGAWARAIDFSSNSSILRGTQIYCSDGTEYGGTIFVCLVSNPSIGTTPITFESKGSIIDGEFLATGAGAYPRAIDVKLSDMVWADDYKQPTDPDDTLCLQRAANVCAINAASGNGETVVRLRSRVHITSATITFAGNTGIIHSGAPDVCVVKRTADFGSTFSWGANGGASAGAITCKGIWFQHSTQYVAGSHTLTAPIATIGGHLEIWGAQNIIIERCYFWRHRFAIIFHGGSILRVYDCSFALCWYNIYSAAQEAVGSIWFDQTSSFGNPKDYFGRGNEFLGADNYPYLDATVLTDAYGNSKTENILPMIGPINHMIVNGCETMTIVGDYFGNAADANIYLNPTGSGYIGNVRFADCMFDAATHAQFRVAMASGGQPVLQLLIEGCDFNGELTTYQHLVILQRGGAPSVDSLRVTDSVFHASYGAAIIISGAAGFEITGNEITNYNCFNVTPQTPPTDAQWGAAIYVEQPDTDEFYGLIDDNTIGGGGNTYAGSGYCWLGIYLDSGADLVRVGKTNYAGVNGQIGISEKQPIILTGGSYTATAWGGTIMCANTTAQTILLPVNAPPGCEKLILDILNASTNNITVNPNGGQINGSSSNVVISTAGGKLKLESAGSNNWRITGT